MNERIRELAEQAEWRFADRATGEFSEYDKRLLKFAELIVRECASAADDWYQNHEQLHWDPATHILAHFGVE